MRAALILPVAFLLAAGAACDPQRIDPCAGLTGTCLGLQVEGGPGVTRVDELSARVVIDGSDPIERVVHPASGPGAVELPVAVALRLASIPDGAIVIVDVGLVGRLGGADVGAGGTRIDMRGGAHGTATLTLRPRDRADGGDTDGGCLLVCPSTIGCGRVSDRCGGTLDCGACAVTSVSPAVARPGSVVTLEGLFSDSATVEFPGGGVATATILGPNRATAVVPASATEGSLIVRTGGGPLPALRFRGVQFRPALGAPQTELSQEDGVARALPSLVSYASYAVVGRYLYAFGGRGAGTIADTVSRAVINLDGTIGGFEPVAGLRLAAPRGGGVTVVFPSAVYLIGGFDGALNAIAAVEKFTIAANGDLTSAGLVPTAVMPEPRARFATALVGDSLYVIGGVTGSVTTGAPIASVIRARVTPSGELSAFAPAPSLAAARRSATAHVIGDWLYVVGGYFAASVDPTATLERSRIMPDGTLGTFETRAGVSLNRARFSHGALVLDNRLYVVGSSLGGGNSEEKLVEWATIQPDGSLSAFTEDPGLSHGSPVIPTVVVAGLRAYFLSDPGRMVAPITVGAAPMPSTSIQNLWFPTGGRPATAAVVANDILHVFGGTVESARVAPDAPPVPMGSATARMDGSAFAVLGNRVYAIGGGAPPSDAGTGERATVEYGTLNRDGTFSGFSVEPMIALTTPRADAAVIAISNTLWVLGGRSGGNPTATTETAPIYDDGTLGTFTAVATSNLATPRDGHRAIVINGRIYVIGGMNSGLLGSVEVSTGGGFAIASGVTLSTPRMGHSLLRVGDKLYVFGGFAGPGVATPAEVATINADGTLSTFTPVPNLYFGGGIAKATFTVADTVHLVGGMTLVDEPDRTINRAVIR
jgi:hypothetical protein